MIFDYDTLVMIFEEAGMDFDTWVTDSGYNSGWSDMEIYNALPADIIATLDSFGLELSWLHGGT